MAYSTPKLTAKHTLAANLLREMKLDTPDPTGDADRLRLAFERKRRVATGVDNPYKKRFYNFLTHCVWSIDEARAGEIRKWPQGVDPTDGRSWDELWLEMEDAYLRCRLLMLEKSRRVLASWFTCCFDIWLCAGGQDPRWVNEDGLRVLMQSDRNRRVIVAARKAQGFGGSEWFIESRIKQILDNFEAYGGRDFWPDFPRWTHRAGEIEFSNGSFITGVPQGSDQARGGACTLLHCEEVAFWEEAASTIGAAIPTMRGGGHIVLVTTPQVGTYAQEIRDGTLQKKKRR